MVQLDYLADQLNEGAQGDYHLQGLVLELLVGEVDDHPVPVPKHRVPKVIPLLEVELIQARDPLPAVEQVKLVHVVDVLGEDGTVGILILLAKLLVLPDIQVHSLLDRVFLEVG